MPAAGDELSTEIFKILNRDLEEKNKQIAEFQSIAHAHNRQLENLNQTIQLSNQTIQQLNSVLALPQVKNVVQTMRNQKHDQDFGCDE
jgi:methyl-accepting chemotaxis protein